MSKNQKEPAKDIFVSERLMSALEKTLAELGMMTSGIKLEHPAMEEHGDYSSNVALATFEQLKVKSEKFKVGNPRELAQIIADRLLANEKVKDIVEKVEIAGPGFINFKLSKKIYLDCLDRIISQNEKYGAANLGKMVRFSVEHTGPNTNKPLHIGHIRNGVLGMSLVNILAKVGYSALSSNINNDRGIHIIKAMWAYQKYGRGLTPETMTVEDWKDISAATSVSTIQLFLVNGKIKPDHFLGLFYVIGNQAEETSEESKKEMHQMLVDWEAGKSEVRALWKQMNGWFYQGSHITLERLGVSFDKEWFESEIYDKGKVIVEDGVARGIFKRFEDGHVEANLEPYGLPNVVLLRGNGTALYITQDFELMRQRMIDEKIHYNMILTDSGQNLRFRQLFKICELLGYGQAEQFIHIGYGTVRIPGGKMSSRLGNVILADDVIQKMKDLAASLMTNRKITTDFISAEEKDRVSESVGIGALKYAILRINPLMDMTFDFEKSVSLEGDSGPYLQYTYARCKSVMNKSTNHLIHKSSNNKLSSLSRTPRYTSLNPEELAVLRWIYRFPEVVLEAAANYSPNLICSFLFELAKRYNSFYHKHSILAQNSKLPSARAQGEGKTQNREEVRNLRLSLTVVTAQVLKNGLEILGIEALERM